MKHKYMAALVLGCAVAAFGWLLNSGTVHPEKELRQTIDGDSREPAGRVRDPLRGDAGKMLEDFEQTIALLGRNQIEHPGEASAVLRRMRDRSPDRFNLSCADFFKGPSFSKYPGMHWDLIEALSDDVRACAKLIESVPALDRRMRLYEMQIGVYESSKQPEPLWLLMSDVLPPGEAGSRAAGSCFRALAVSGDWHLVRQRVSEIPYREYAYPALQGIFQSFSCNKGPKPTVEEWRGIVDEARKLGTRNNFDDLLAQGEHELESQ